MVCLQREELDEPLLGVVYDRRRSSSHEHRVAQALRGPLAPSAGERFKLLLRCPNYPGWSASCGRASLRVDCEQQEGLETLLYHTTGHDIFAL